MSPDLSIGSSVCGILDKQLISYLVLEPRRSMLRGRSPILVGVVHKKCEQ